MYTICPACNKALTEPTSTFTFGCCMQPCCIDCHNKVNQLATTYFLHNGSPYHTKPVRCQTQGNDVCEYITWICTSIKNEPIYTADKNPTWNWSTLVSGLGNVNVWDWQAGTNWNDAVWNYHALCLTLRLFKNYYFLLLEVLNNL